MAREGELAVVPRGVDHHGASLEHALPEMRDFAARAIALACRCDVDDGVLEQAESGGGEAAGVGPGEGVAAGEARSQAQLLGPRHDRPLDRAHVGDHRAGGDVRQQRLEQRQVGGGRRSEHQQLGGAGDIGRTRGRIVDRAALRGRSALRRIGRPAEHGGDPGPLRLERERAADRAEADDAEGGGAHGGEASGFSRPRKRNGRLGEEPPARSNASARRQLLWIVSDMKVPEFGPGTYVSANTLPPLGGVPAMWTFKRMPITLPPTNAKSWPVSPLLRGCDTSKTKTVPS